MPSYSSLTPAQKIQYAKDVSMANNGVTQPNTTAVNNINLDKLIAETSADINATKQLIGSIQLTSGSSPYTYPIPFSSLPPDIQNEFKKFIPPGYTPPVTITGQEIIDTTQGVLNSLQELRANPATLPKAGAGSIAAVQPTETSTTSKILTAAAVIGGGALLLNSLNSAPRIESPAPDPIPDPRLQASLIEANDFPVDKVDIATDPNTNIGNENIENSSPATIDVEDALEKARLESQADYNNLPPRTEQDIIGAYGGMQGLQGSVNDARAKQITQDAENAKTKGDWRVRLSLAPSASYLYKSDNPGILSYLQATDGVVFPYTPQISVNYAAHYESSDLVHSNYKLFQYKNSSVDQVTITCDFTAQDTFEANYLLAVIHFFRSVTKMFYGKDQQPGPGVPPPLCYLSGLGEFQFDKHPLVITNFNYSLPNDVDYIRAGSPTLEPGVDSTGYNDKNTVTNIIQTRLQNLLPGAQAAAPRFSKATNTQPTYVPTKIQIALTAYPITTRNDISNNFSLKEYATGKLLQGSKNVGGGGIW